MVKFIRSSKAFRTLFIPSAAAGLAAALALAPQAANAAGNGTITFNGKVLSSTCSLSNGTSGNLTVTLPDVQVAKLASAGAVTGNTSFAMNLSGCPTTPSGVKVSSVFSGTGIDTRSTAGLLTNQTASSAGGASNVEVQLLTGAGGKLDLTKSTAAAQGSPYVTISSSGTATLNYQARYYATGAAQAGLVSANVTYTLVYQ